MEMEPINERLLGSATLAYNMLAYHTNASNIIPLRNYISEFLFMNTLNTSRDQIEVCFYHANEIDTQELSDPSNKCYKQVILDHGKGINLSLSIDYPTSMIQPHGYIVAVLAIPERQRVFRDMVVLDSPCQALPVFALRVSDYDHVGMMGDIESRDMVNELLVMPINDSLMPCAELLKSQYPKVKLGVIYQLVLNATKHVGINDAYESVSNALDAYDYEGY